MGVQLDMFAARVPPAEEAPAPQLTLFSSTAPPAPAAELADPVAPPPASVPLKLPDLIPALTLSQPFAGLVAAVPAGGGEALKSLETRTSRIYHRGPLVILAGQKKHELFDTLWPRIPAWAQPLCLLHGVALALVDVVGCRLLRAEDEPRSWYWDSSEAAPRYAWELADVRRLAQLEVRGRQGLALKLTRSWVEEALQGAP